MPGDRCRWKYSLWAGHRAALEAREHAWRTELSEIRQRTGVRLKGSPALAHASEQANIDTAHIDPGKPWQNGSNESFNGKFRDECLSMQWFKNRSDAKILIENFRREYNEIRPHSSLGQLTPVQFKQTLSTTNPKAAFPK
jgi:transposase InsO family protein